MQEQSLEKLCLASLIQTQWLLVYSIQVCRYSCHLANWEVERHIVCSTSVIGDISKLSPLLTWYSPASYTNMPLSHCITSCTCILQELQGLHLIGNACRGAMSKILVHFQQLEQLQLSGDQCSYTDNHTCPRLCSKSVHHSAVALE